MTKITDRKAGSTPVLLTANRLTDGVVLWMAGDTSWSENHDDSVGFTGAGLAMARDQAKADFANQRIISLYEITIDGTGNHSAREQIRAAKGPSIQPPRDRHNQEVSNV
jgi:hypothetical protein